MDLWRWPIQIGESGRNVKFAPDKLKFGRGYTQRVATLEVEDEDTFDISVQGPYEEVKEMEDFLREHRGAISFDFLLPYEGTPIRVVCEEYSVRYRRQISGTLTATFERVHESP